MKGNRRILFFLCRPLERIVEPSRRPLIEIEHVFVTYPGTERHIPVSYTHLDVYKRQVQAFRIAFA